MLAEMDQSSSVNLPLALRFWGRRQSDSAYDEGGAPEDGAPEEERVRWAIADIFDEEEEADEARVDAAALTVQVQVLMRSLILEIRKHYALRSLPFFVLFLILFTVSAANAFLYMPQTREGLLTNEAVSDNLMLRDQFRQIFTPEDFFGWLRLAVRNLWAHGIEGAIQTGPSARRAVGQRSGTAGAGGAGAGNRDTTGGVLPISAGPYAGGFFAARQNVPLHWLLVRQRRVVKRGCTSAAEHQAEPITSELRAVVLRECMPSYEEGLLNATGFRLNSSHPQSPHVAATTDPFVADAEKTARLPLLMNARGKLNDYGPSGSEFTLALPYSLTITAAEEVLADMQANDWLDHATRLLTIETFTFNPTTGRYAHVQFVAEISASGEPAIRPDTGQLWLLVHDRAGSTFAFAVDLASAVYGAWMIKEIVWQIKTAVATGQEPVGVWEFLAVIHFCMLMVYLGFRLKMWQEAEEVGSNLPPVDLYDRLSTYHYTVRMSRQFGLAALWLAWLRVLEHIRYNKRLRSVLDTIYLATNDLISLGLFTGLVVLGFALLANGLYGNDMYDFSTLWDSTTWLVRATVTADMAQWNEMVELAPLWTPVLVFLFFVLSWLVLLNLVLSILTNGFSVAAHAEEHWSWSLKDLRGDFRSLIGEVRQAASCREESEGDEEEGEQRRSTEPTTGDGRDGADDPWAAPQKRRRSSGASQRGAQRARPNCCIAFLTGGEYVRRRVSCINVLADLLATQEQRHNEHQDRLAANGLRAPWQRVTFADRKATVSLATLMAQPEWSLSEGESARIVQNVRKATGMSFAELEDDRQRHQQAMVRAVDRMTRRTRRAISVARKELRHNVTQDLLDELDDYQDRLLDEMWEQTQRVEEADRQSKAKLHSLRTTLDAKADAMIGLVQEATERILTAVTALGTDTRVSVDTTVMTKQDTFAAACASLRAVLGELLGWGSVAQAATEAETRVRKELEGFGSGLRDAASSPGTPRFSPRGSPSARGGFFGPAAAGDVASSEARLRKEAKLDALERRLLQQELELKRRKSHIEAALRRVAERDAELSRQARDSEPVRHAELQSRGAASLRQYSPVSTHGAGLSRASPSPRRAVQSPRTPRRGVWSSGPSSVGASWLRSSAAATRDSAARSPGSPLRRRAHSVGAGATSRALGTGIGGALAASLRSRSRSVGPSSLALAAAAAAAAQQGSSLRRRRPVGLEVSTDRPLTPVGPGAGAQRPAWSAQLSPAARQGLSRHVLLGGDSSRRARPHSPAGHLETTRLSYDAPGGMDERSSVASSNGGSVAGPAGAPGGAPLPSPAAGSQRAGTPRVLGTPPAPHLLAPATE